MVWVSHVICYYFMLMYNLQVIIGEETFHGICGLSFVIRLSRATVAFNSSTILALFSGLVSTQARFYFFVFFPSSF